MAGDGSILSLSSPRALGDDDCFYGMVYSQASHKFISFLVFLFEAIMPVYNLTPLVIDDDIGYVGVAMDQTLDATAPSNPISLCSVTGFNVVDNQTLVMQIFPGGAITLSFANKAMLAAFAGHITETIETVQPEVLVATTPHADTSRDEVPFEELALLSVNTQDNVDDDADDLPRLDDDANAGSDSEYKLPTPPTTTMTLILPLKTRLV